MSASLSDHAQGPFTAGVANAHSIEGAAGGAEGSDSGRTAQVVARDAVSTVVKIADQQASRSEMISHSVNLGFKFGSEDLAVRVELRGGEVHTRFTTDSAELKEAISGEWQVMTAGAAARHLSFSSPDFSMSGRRQDASFSEGAPSRRDEPERGGAFPGKDGPAQESAPSETSSSAAEPDASDLRLHAFA